MSRADEAVARDYAGLDAHIRTVVAPKLELLEARRKRQYLISRLVFFVLILVVVPFGVYGFISWADPAEPWQSYISLYFGLWVFGVIFAGVVAASVTKGVRRDAKTALVSGITDHLGWSFNVAPEKPAVMKYLTEIKMHHRLRREIYEDAITGEVLRHKFTITEARLSTGKSRGRGKNATTFAFTGVVLTVALPKPFFAQTVLRRMADDLDWRNIESLKKIGFADPDFNKTYEVFSSDPVEAYYLLSPDVMETFKEAANDMGGRLTACIFWNGSLTLMISTNNRYEPASSAKAFGSDKQFKKVKREIWSVYRMIEKVEYYLTHRDPKDFRRDKAG